MKEVKVYKYLEEDDNFNELWKVIDPEPGTPKYFARHVYKGFGTWYYVCDPLGYCELDHVVPNDIVFVICKDKAPHKELFKNSNVDEPFDTFDIVSNTEWDKIKKHLSVTEEDLDKDFWAEAIMGETTMELNKWLLSFKDPGLYGEEAKTYDENWCYCRYEITSYERIENTSFDYLGYKYSFYRVHYKHTICGVEWIEYHVSRYYQKGDFISFGFFGSDFKKEYGTMYSTREAKLLVIKALKEIYTAKFDKISKIVDSYGYVHEQKMTFSDAAENLLNRNYNREYVHKIIENEKVNHHFYGSDEKEKMEHDYPGYHKDYNIY